MATNCGFNEMQRRWSWTLSVVCCLSCGCSLARSATLSATAGTVDSLVASMRRQPDPELVRTGFPTILLIIDGLVLESPQDPALLRAAINGYVSYCQAFLSDESDSKRAAKLYGRAREYGLRLLRRHAFFERALDGDMEPYERALDEFTADDVPDLHAAASAWLGWIIAKSDSMGALAELPRALALMERVLELDETYGNGSGHLVFAVVSAVQPRGAGQDLKRSKTHFERAIELAGPEVLLSQVLYAEYYGKATLDEEFFTRTLEQVLESDPAEYPQHRLLNELAHERALLLLEKREDIF